MAEVTIVCCGQDVLYHSCDGTATCMVCGAHYTMPIVWNNGIGEVPRKGEKTE